ncbi:hypothetical protein ACHAXA_011121 [Cyclostephanos tholiformis]|uniref:Uncharacterized protein n=1 Tax=Cyclostephanos tholiformis TaxID=382380 RepID=A0ABD3SEU5_9STRA
MMHYYPAGVFVISSLAASTIVVSPPRRVAAFSPGGSSRSATTTTKMTARHLPPLAHYYRGHRRAAAAAAAAAVVRRRRSSRADAGGPAAAVAAASSSHSDDAEIRDDPDEYENENALPTNDNPYADPNYPDLEFVNYDDPTYSADRSEYSDGSDVDNVDGVETTLAEIEAMREERRRRNDEYQFETYHASVLRGGERSLGEWTVFETDTFMGRETRDGRDPSAIGVPRLLKWDKVLKVVSRGTKNIVNPDAEWRVDGERIVHEERLATPDDFPTLMMIDDEDDDDDESLVGGEAAGGGPSPLNWDSVDVAHVEYVRCYPSEMSSVDFRGPGGNMCVGKAYTICDATPLSSSSSSSIHPIDDDNYLDDHDDDARRRREQSRHEGPFREMRTELGVQENGMRFRVKLDYALLEEDDSFDDSDSGGGDADAVIPPPLHLRTLTVCRETLDGYWPKQSDNESMPSSSSSVEAEGGGGGDSAGGQGGVGGGSKGELRSGGVRRSDHQEEITRALFGPPGAPGGLYDPPPVGSEERAISNYMLLDLEGGATLLLPHRLDQHLDMEVEVEATSETSSPSSSSSSSSSFQLGWVTSLDWTPGRIRYQVDRKVLGGTKLKGLRTLELSEVQGDDADRWRPRDGGSDMRQ